eukprot:6209410-Prymnesium_polylepis.1
MRTQVQRSASTKRSCFVALAPSPGDSAKLPGIVNWSTQKRNPDTCPRPPDRAAAQMAQWRLQRHFLSQIGGFSEDVIMSAAHEHDAPCLPAPALP